MPAEQLLPQVLRQPNINFLWAALLVEELRRQGVGCFFLAPGSRSAPLIFAVGKDPRIHSQVHFDERALAFMACGYAAASGKPAVLICTSGTAAANFLPGLIEASKKKLPLIVLTADRPPELQKTGAAQSIEQTGLFSTYTRWSAELPCPTMEINPEYVLTTAAQAVSRAKGELPGPVHINVLFREPLSPVKQSSGLARYTTSIKSWALSNKPFTSYFSRTAQLSEDALKHAATRIHQIKNGLVLAGKLGSQADRQAVLTFAEKTGWPILADITSGLRLGPQHKNVISYFDQALTRTLPSLGIDGVVHFGGRMTSKNCYELLKKSHLNDYLMILAHPLRSDPLHKVTARFNISPAIFVDQIFYLLAQRTPSKSLDALQKANSAASRQIDQNLARSALCEPGIARAISKIIPAGQGLFLSNSMPVRDMDSYAASDGNAVTVGANRGANGIDGIIASGIGFAAGLKQTTTLVIGDLAFLYDLNSLALLKTAEQKLIIVLINNDGGKIFSRLAGAERSAFFAKYFTASHGLNFRSAANLFALRYYVPGSTKAFVKDYARALKARGSSLIEVII
ncbi:MAG: 2-succinyl-5-enolpyruvyl-6-hydroxy-3-cyclohexene-1-carboxylic-acid synthase [Candidatus Omnitrophica bacterium]|nr:2-succinyl-5-enolpyruvyl-6-hydroxy-3-cyclohexene-1-carboxylic-acid synthase [Candidatus Omnitrophota bacterium]